ncbi:hypothetical protein [Pseudomonas yamanorum]|uniref:Uncharacterized protein n=1 Tax=Pseudomonas yamanorum TaxID=515393 RepID=A0A7Y8K6X2_9PSED|nr:hypothetical protein [Pseudomonas yamanorum]NWE77739.1 hypothetical protein [Pseudomonas yamanorum]
MRLISAVFMLLVAHTALAFEIRPLGPYRGGNDPASSWPVLYYRADNVANQCKPKSYVVRGQMQGVHEYITRNAYQIAYGKVLRGVTWQIPLLGGVEWNDDPEELARKAWHYGGVKMLLAYGKRIDNPSLEDKITRRSHFGDMQFLHAMLPLGMENDQDAAKAKIMDWIKATYEVAIGNVEANSLRKESFYHTYFGKIGCGRTAAESRTKDCSVMDVFDMKLMYRVNGDLNLSLQWLATGSIAHIIQDSFSASHADRSNGRFIMKTYDATNQLDHCESDGAVARNKPNIERAISATSGFFVLVRDKAPWSRAEPYFKALFAVPTTPETFTKIAQ